MVENIARDQVKLEKDQRKAEEILHSNINEEKISKHDNNMKENKLNIHGVEDSVDIRSNKKRD